MPRRRAEFLGPVHKGRQGLLVTFEQGGADADLGNVVVLASTSFRSPVKSRIELFGREDLNDVDIHLPRKQVFQRLPA